MKTNKYHEFIKGALAVGFTDDQVDFLEEWILNTPAEAPKPPQEESKQKFPIESPMDKHIRDTFRSNEEAIRADERKRLLDKAIEELDGKKVDTNKYTSASYIYGGEMETDIGYNAGLSTAISHLTNLRDKLKEK